MSTERTPCKVKGCEKNAVMRGDKFAYGGNCSKHYNEERQARKADRSSVKESAASAADAEGEGQTASAFQTAQVTAEAKASVKLDGETQVVEDDTEGRLKNGKRAKKLPFGWCADGNHSHCRYQYMGDFGVHVGHLQTCICECHVDGPCPVCGDVSNHYKGLTRCKVGGTEPEPTDEEKDEQ